jgi:hypothetical protein
VREKISCEVCSAKIVPAQYGPIPKYCSSCRADRQQESSKQFVSGNREKINAKARKWRQENPEKAREASRRSQAKRRKENPESVKREKLRSSYKLADKEIDDLRIRADGFCELCEKRFGVDSGSRPVIDHEHSSGVVRGLLCGNCNTALGMIEDSVETLQRLSQYLKNPPGISK